MRLLVVDAIVFCGWSGVSATKLPDIRMEFSQVRQRVEERRTIHLWWGGVPVVEMVVVGRQAQGQGSLYLQGII